MERFENLIELLVEQEFKEPTLGPNYINLFNISQDYSFIDQVNVNNIKSYYGSLLIVYTIKTLLNAYHLERKIR